MEYFTKIEKIGEGTYGVVYKARHKFTGQLVAMKKVRMDTDDGIPSTSIREISLLKELKHPNIVTLDDVLLDHTYLYLVFEFLTMDLRRYMDTLGPDNSIGPSWVKSYMYQINSAILYCHQRGVMHRDLKPQNLLIDKTGIIKVADFGLGRCCASQAKVYTHEVVTLWYRAPEVLLGSTQYSFPIDVWAMGCIFAEMLSKKPLFRGDSEIDQLFRIFKVLGTPTEAVWPRVSSLPDYKCTFPSWKTIDLEHYMANKDANAIDLLRRMLIYNPKKRILAKAIEQHPYFGDVKLPSSLKHYYTLRAIKIK